MEAQIKDLRDEVESLRSQMSTQVSPENSFVQAEDGSFENLQLDTSEIAVPEDLKSICSSFNNVSRRQHRAAAKVHQVSQVCTAMDKFWTRQLEGQQKEDEFRVLRQSILTGKWILYTGGGAHQKPKQYSDALGTLKAENQPVCEARCPFCVGNEKKTPDPILCFDCEGTLVCGPELPEDWRVRVVPNIFPMFSTPWSSKLYGDSFKEKVADLPHSSVALGRHTNGCTHVSRNDLDESLFPQLDAVGYSEVVIEDRRHNGLLAIVDAGQIELSLRALQMRGRVLAQMPEVKQLMFFKQYGPLSGGSLVHPHMQVITLPLVTPEYQNRIRRSADFHKSCGCCPVCRCFRDEPTGHGPASTRLVYATEHFVVSVPFACASPYSLVIVPRVHHESWLTIPDVVLADLAYVLQLVMGAAYDLLNDPSYNLNFISADTDDMMLMTYPGNTSSRHSLARVSSGKLVGSPLPSMSFDAGSSESDTPMASSTSTFHWHLEVDFRFPADLGGVEIASGIRVISGLPEDFAKELRAVVAARERVVGRHDTVTDPLKPPLKYPGS